MKKQNWTLPLFLLTAAIVTPAVADEFRPVNGYELTGYVGANLYGQGHTNLGIVDQVDPNLNLIAVVRGSEFAIIHTSALASDGFNLRAPNLTINDINRASADNLHHPGTTIVTPSIEIQEGYYEPDTYYPPDTD